MPFKIAIASGKGGTGKTSVSVNLFHYLNKNLCDNIRLVDCDVEEPNDVLFFTQADKIKEKEIFQLIPEINNKACTYCRKCVEYCEFNAIVVIPSVKFAEVNASLCHSCGACLAACEDHAIKERPESIGNVSFYNTNIGKGLTEGKLKIGSSMQTMLIRELKKSIPGDEEVILYDAPPGTSCPVVETINDTDYVILVTEPTPFGFHDLRIMVELMHEIQKPFGVIINKARLGNSEVYDYLGEKDIEIIGEIPYMQEYASCYAEGNLFNNIPGEISASYIKISKKLEKRIMVHEGNHYFKW